MRETSWRYTWLSFVGRQFSATHSKHASMQTTWHCRPSTTIWTIFADLFTIRMHALSMDIWRVQGTEFTDSFHVQRSHPIHSWSIGPMVTIHTVCMPCSAQKIEATLELTSLRGSSQSWFTIYPIIASLFQWSTIATLPCAHNRDFTCYWIELRLNSASLESVSICAQGIFAEIWTF